MVRLDRYILSQLMGPFGLFALVLIGVYWLNRAVGIFDQLIGDGHSLPVFLELIILFLPQVILIVLPMIGFTAAVYVSNRLHSDSEIVVLQAAGISPYRLARPFVIFSLMVTVLAGLLSHVLVPSSNLAMTERTQALSQDIIARLIAPGAFLHPADGITFYIREIDPNGELNDIFLHDQRSDSRINTYTASRALLLRNGESAKLIMFDGLAQTLDLEDQRLSKVHFEDFVFDMTSLIDQNFERKLRIDDFSTVAALFPTAAMAAETGISIAEFQYAAHDRILQPIHVFVFPLIGMAALMLGGFSRFGMARQIVLAVVIILGLSLLVGPMQVVVRGNISLWPLMYLPDFLGVAFTLVMLKLAARSQRQKRLMPSLGGGALP